MLEVSEGGKVQVLTGGFDEEDSRAIISGLPSSRSVSRASSGSGSSRTPSKQSGRSAMVFSSLLEVPEPLFKQVDGGVEDVDGTPFPPDDSSVCLLPNGGMERPKGRKFYRPTLTRDSTTDHCHTAGQQLKSINKWEQWVIDRTGAVDEQGKAVGDTAAFIKSKLLPDLVLTEAENPHGLGFAVTVAKKEARNPRQLWTFHVDGTISPLSSPTKYLTFHQAGEASESSAAAMYAAYINLSAQVTVTEVPVNAVNEHAVHVAAHAAAPIGSNAHPADCETHVLSIVHTSDSMAKIISAVRSSVVELTEACHAKGVSDVQLATFDTDFHHCSLGADEDWRGNVRRLVRVGTGTDYMLPCEFLFRYLREGKEQFSPDKCHRVHVVFLADGRAKRRPNQSWLDDCQGLIQELEKRHVLVTLHVVSVAQGSQFDFLYPLSEVCGDRGTMDYVSSAAEVATSAEEQVKACFDVLVGRWLDKHAVPFVPFVLHLADGTAEGYRVCIVADSQEPAQDRQLAKWRHKVLFSGSAVVRLASQAAVTHLCDNINECLLQHQDGRQPNDSVAWTFTKAGPGIEAAQATLMLLQSLERDWFRTVLAADDTFGHPLAESLGPIKDELKACHACMTELSPLPEHGPPFSTAGRVPPGHDGETKATASDLKNLQDEQGRHERALASMSALMNMHILEDQALEAIGTICKEMSGIVPPMSLRDRVPLRFFFDPSQRYLIRMHGAKKHFGLKGNSARLLDHGAGFEVPWQLAPVVGKPGRYTMRTCWREGNRDRRTGYSLGVSNGNLQLYPANDNKNLAEWEITLASATESTYTVRYRAAIPGKGSDGMHVGFSDEGNGKLLGNNKPVVEWSMSAIEDTRAGAADLTVEQRLDQMDVALGGEEAFAWDAACDGDVMARLAQLPATTTSAAFADVIDNVFHQRPNLNTEAFDTAFQGPHAPGTIDSAALRQGYQRYRLTQLLMQSVPPSDGVYESILDELPYTFKYEPNGTISDDEFASGVLALMVELTPEGMQWVEYYMRNNGSESMHNFSKFEELWGYADTLARLRVDREALAAAEGADEDNGINGAGRGDAQNDIVLSTQPKARRDRPARNQQWGLHQPGFQTVGQWRLCRNESLEWQKQALVWPTPPHLNGAFNDELHWPLRGVLVAHAPWSNENEILKKMLPRTTAKVATALFVRVVPNGLYDDDEAYKHSVSVQVPHAMIEGGSGGSGGDDGKEGSGSNPGSPERRRKKGLGQLPVPTQQWLNRTLGQSADGETNGAGDTTKKKVPGDPRLGMLLQACTETLGYTVPARKVYTEKGKLVKSVAELIEYELERKAQGEERQQLLFVSRGERFGEGPPAPGTAEAPTTALNVAPTFGAIVFHMGQDDDDESLGHKVTARPEKRAATNLNDADALRAYLDEVGERLNMSNYVRSLHFRDGSELTSLKVEYKEGGTERVWPHLWVSCGEPFVPPDKVPLNIYRKQQKELSASIRQIKEEMQQASPAQRKDLRKELSLKKKELKASEVVPSTGTTVKLNEKWNRMAKPNITVKTILARWMGEREAVAPVRCRGRDMEELLISCNDRLPKQASRPRRMFTKSGEEITDNFESLQAGKMTQEVWVSMGEDFTTRSEMVEKRKAKAKLATSIRRACPTKHH
eukprot:m.67969 g.67969  ORF g.67969 m.67969 type:complete len:1640 (-) comp8481_c0_seq1:119-5038(-)